MRRLSALVVIVPLGALMALALANVISVYKLEHFHFDVAAVGGTYGFHAGAPVRAYQLTKKAWAPASASKLSLARGAQMTLGVETKTGPFGLWRVAWFQQAVKRDVDFVQYSRPWPQPFQSFLAQDVWRRGAIPLLTWEPWSYAAGAGPGGAKIDQPRFALKTIISGSHDRYIRAYARAIKRFGHPLLLRFAPEMNGNWNAWSEGRNGNTSGQYVLAWRHIHRLFTAEKADNVIWVWAPNVLYQGSKPLAELYPGPSYVDVVALDGYNWGRLHPWSRWHSFSSVFSSSLNSFKSLAPNKPVLITETASTELGGSKAAWIRDLFSGLRQYPEIIGVNWFNQIKETDWRVQSSPAAEQAFAAEARHFPTSPAAARFRGRLYRIDTRLAPYRQAEAKAAAVKILHEAAAKSRPRSGKSGGSRSLAAVTEGQ